MGNEEKSLVPSYWRQKETRQRQISIHEEPHISIQEEPQPKPEKHLVRETKGAEKKLREFHKRRLTLPEKIIIIVGIVAVLGLFIFILK